MPSIFERKNAADQSAEKQERRTSHLERKIGQLLIEKEFLEKKCDQLVRSAGNRSERKAMIDPSDQETLHPQAGQIVSKGPHGQTHTLARAVPDKRSVPLFCVPFRI
jgi:hypothetical protein